MADWASGGCDPKKKSPRKGKHDTAKPDDDLNKHGESQATEVSSPKDQALPGRVNEGADKGAGGRPHEKDSEAKEGRSAPTKEVCMLC